MPERADALLEGPGIRYCPSSGHPPRRPLRNSAAIAVVSRHLKRSYAWWGASSGRDIVMARASFRTGLLAPQISQLFEQFDDHFLCAKCGSEMNSRRMNRFNPIL
jgi:hypothetical protein